MYAKLSILAAVCTFALSSAPAHAAELAVGPHTYVGAAIGRTAFKVGDLGSAKNVSDESAQAARVYAGYRFSENFGIEGGYARLGSVAETTGTGATLSHQDAKVRSLYGAVTGRLPLGESFALTGKAGVSFGHVGTHGNPTTANDLGGSARSMLVGVGAEYRINQQLGLTLSYDRFGKFSDKVTGASLVSAGVNYRF